MWQEVPGPFEKHAPASVMARIALEQAIYLGKLGFYLEALDRDVKKPHEQAAIGVLLCASKDEEVVEYALSRSLSPALIADYQTQLPDKALLQAKLHELYAQSAAADPAESLSGEAAP